MKAIVYRLFPHSGFSNYYHKLVPCTWNLLLFSSLICLTPALKSILSRVRVSHYSSDNNISRNTVIL